MVEPGQSTPTLEGTPVGVAMTLSRRIGWLEAGLGVDGAVGATAFHVSAGAELGVALPIGTKGRLEVLGQAGMHGYLLTGSAFFSVFSTADSAFTPLPYVGGKLVLGWTVASHLRVGAGAVAQLDLSHALLNQTVTTCLFWCTTTTDRYRVGGWQAGPNVTLAADF